MHTRIKIISILLILLALISPPFVFSQLPFFGKEMRGMFGIAVLLLLYLENTKLKFSEIIFFILLITILILEILSQRSSLNNALSTYAVIFVAYSIYRVLRTNNFTTETFLRIWMRFSLIISILAIISFFVNQFTNFNTDFVSFNSSESLFNPNYDYKISIFGLTVFKKFPFFEVERVSSFFIEPQYAGMFFAFNLLIISKSRKLFSTKYYLAILLAGLLTFSITFYLVLTFLLIVNLKFKPINIVLTVLISLLFFVIISYSFNINFETLTYIISQTSFQDRMERNLYAVEVIKDASTSKLLFGHGINNFLKYTNDELGRGLSSGFLYLFFEFGVLLSCLVLYLSISFSNKNLTLILISMIYLVVMPWYRYYFCWYAIILCGLNYYNYKTLVNVSKLKKNIQLRI